MKLVVISVFLPFAAALWPVPSTPFSAGESVLWMDQQVKVVYNKPQSTRRSVVSRDGANSSAATVTAQQIVDTAVNRTRDAIFSQAYVPWKFHPRNSNFEPDSNGTKTLITSITLDQIAEDVESVGKPKVGEVDESYKLDVTLNGTATITANSSVGIARGLTTFSQLFYKHSKGGVYTSMVPVTIEDAPKFPYRGLNMDVARSYFPVADIKRTLDGMAFNKMNRFHLHITDAQSWPLEIPSMPELAEKGAYGAGMTYTPSDLDEIQAYGASLGIAVTLEIDMPGHTSSIAFSHPELIAAFNAQPNWDTYCAEPPCGTLKLNSTDVTAFLDKLWADLLPRVSPYTSYFHIGGDEVKAAAYNLDDTVNSNDTAVLQPLVEAFVKHNSEKVKAAGLTPMVWEEMLLQWNVTLDKDVIVQTWQSDDALAQTVSKGYKALAGNYNYWYLDCGKGQWLDFRQGPSAQTYWPYADYCSPTKNWRLMYSYDPLSGVPANATDLVLGGEAHIWTEQTDSVNLDRMVWPRACAAAEVLWSGAKDGAGKNRSQTDASPRLADMRERLVARGIQAEPIQMPFCTMNGTQCVL